MKREGERTPKQDWFAAPRRVEGGFGGGFEPPTVEVTVLQICFRTSSSRSGTLRGSRDRGGGCPAAGRLATHYYLQAAIAHAAGPQHFARGQLFLFWIDSPPGVSSTAAPSVPAARF